MPEGHVIHRLAEAFNQTFAGSVVSASSPQGRFDAAVLDRQVFAQGEAWGKHLFLDFVDAPSVHIHLGLIGKLAFEPLAPPRGQVRLRINNDVVAADLRGPQWCRLIDAEQRQKVIDSSGPDPLRRDADPSRGFAKIRRSNKPIAALLMDQKIVAGAGNIFRAEVLFRHRLDPMVPGCTITQRSWDVLWSDLVFLMSYATDHGRIDTVRDEHSPQAQGRAPRVDRHGGEVYVYRRAGMPCLVCHAPIRTTQLEGRNLYWCPRCQVRKTAA